MPVCDSFVCTTQELCHATISSHLDLRTIDHGTSMNSMGWWMVSHTTLLTNGLDSTRLGSTLLSPSHQPLS